MGDNVFRDRQLTALHEAGHVVLQELFFPGEQYAVDIRGIAWIAQGRTVPSPQGWPLRTTKEQIECDILKTLGGIAAESIEKGQDWYNSGGASVDIQSACRSLMRLNIVPGQGGNNEKITACVNRFEKDLDSSYRTVKRLLQENWHMVKLLAKELLIKELLSADMVRSLWKAKEK